MNMNHLLLIRIIKLGIFIKLSSKTPISYLRLSQAGSPHIIHHLLLAQDVGTLVLGRPNHALNRVLWKMQKNKVRNLGKMKKIKNSNVQKERSKFTK